MTCTVELFAAARDAAGAPRLTLSLPEHAAVSDLRHALLKQAPGLQRFQGRLWIAINGRYAADNERLPPDAEAACFPPVSGG